MVLADLDHEVRKNLPYAMLGVDDYRLDIKASSFEISSGFFINCLVFSGDFLPIQILF